MPTYQYACTNPECGNEFELVQSFTDPAASECPVCGSPVRKRYGSVGVVFKGSGFYRTDSRAESGAKNGSKGSGSTESGSGDKSSPDRPSADKPATKSGESTSPSTSSGDSAKKAPAASGNGSASGSGSSGRVAASA